MEQKKEDRRIRITKRAIRESLIELMEREPITKISVKMICEAADINRSTFYAHYKDQYDLLQAIQREVIDEVKERISSTQFFEDSASAISVLAGVLEYGKNNASLLKVLLSEHGDTSFQNEIMELAQEKILDEMGEERTLAPKTLEYLRRFAVAGLVSIIRYWLERDCEDDLEMVAGLMMELLKNGTSGLYAQR